MSTENAQDATTNTVQTPLLLVLPRRCNGSGANPGKSISRAHAESEVGHHALRARLKFWSGQRSARYAHLRPSALRRLRANALHCISQNGAVPPYPSAGNVVSGRGEGAPAKCCSVSGRGGGGRPFAYRSLSRSSSSSFLCMPLCDAGWSPKGACPTFPSSESGT